MQFPSTHWSQIRTLGRPNDPAFASQLEALARRYWRPVYNYIRAVRPLSRGDAEDLTQGFFVMLLTRVDFAALRSERGSFRGFLKVALRRYMASAERLQARRHAADRDQLLPSHEAGVGLTPASPEAPDEAFDRQWARDILSLTYQRLAQALRSEGKGLHYDLFHAYCLAGDGDVSYATLARRFGLAEHDVRNRLHAARVRGRHLLREALREHALPGDDIDADLALLLRA